MALITDEAMKTSESKSLDFESVLQRGKLD